MNAWIVVPLILISTGIGWLVWYIRPRPRDATKIAEIEWSEWLNQVSPVIEAMRILSLSTVTKSQINVPSFERVAEKVDKMYRFQLEELMIEPGSIVELVMRLAQWGEFVVAAEDGEIVAYTVLEWQEHQLEREERRHGQAR